MRYKSIIICTFVLLLWFAYSAKTAFGEETSLDTNDEQIKEYENQIEKLEKKIANLESREKTLQNEIEYADNQIALTELKIQAGTVEIERKTNQIEKLKSSIDDIKIKIQKLAASILHQEQVYGERKRQHYKTADSTPPDVEFFLFLIEPSQLSKKIQKETYSEVMQSRDKKLLDEMNNTKKTYGEQKNLFEQRKAEEESLKAQLEKYKASFEIYKRNLDIQKLDKQKLLKETQNSEVKYQALLAQIQSELDALKMADNLPVGEGIEIKQGDVIGYMGNTGCSSGPHVHFGYIKDGKARDPLPLLKSGYLKWPVKNYDITQYFGENYSFYMRNFGIPGHDALDIRSTTQWTGAALYASKGGTLYRSQDSKVYCPWLNNTKGNGAIIDHGNGEKTIYWHLR